MITLEFDKVDTFVAKQQRKGVQVHWNGWDMVFFKNDNRAKRNPSGCRNDTSWGFETVVSPNKEGTWVVSPSLLRGNDARGR